MSKVHLELPDGQALVAQVPNGELRSLQDKDRVYVDLHNAKIFSPAHSVRSDELAAS